MYLLGHRYYDLNHGRFLNQDPSGISGGLNLYSYGSNNPVNRTDPSGLMPLGMLTASLLCPRSSGWSGGSLWNPSLILPLTGMALPHTGPNARKWPYAMYDGANNFLKWGQSWNPATRYSGPYLEEEGGENGKAWVEPLINGPGSQILEMETTLVRNFPGPQNGESFAATGGGNANLPGLNDGVQNAIQSAQTSNIREFFQSAGDMVENGLANSWDTIKEVGGEASQLVENAQQDGLPPGF